MEVVDPPGKPLHRPFYAPENPERAEKLEYWAKRREEPLAAAIAKDENVELGVFEKDFFPEFSKSCTFFNPDSAKISNNLSISENSNCIEAIS